MEAVARVLGVSVDAIERFDEKAVLHVGREINQPTQSLKEIVDYFKEEIAKRDKKIEQLRSELERSIFRKDTF